MILYNIELSSINNNRSGRIYTKSCLDKIVEDFAEKQSLGESFNNRRDTKLDMMNVCYIHNNLRVVDHKLIADTKILSNSEAFINSLDGNFRFGLRGIGIVNKDKTVTVTVTVTEISAVSFDLVEK